MNETFTPGPWQVSQFDRDTLHVRMNGIIVAECMARTGGYVREQDITRRCAENRANARGGHFAGTQDVCVRSISFEDVHDVG